MVYETKIQQAESIIAAFNATAEKKIDWNNFLQQLKDAGGTSDEALSECSWEDLKVMGAPPLIAKQLAKVFRQTDNSKPKVISSTRAGVMTPKELIENYIPGESDNPVGERLKTLSKGKRFIVFNDDETINDISVQLLQEIRDGYPERETCIVDSKPRQVYAVGDKLNNLADVNPLYPNRILRPDGTCDQTNRSWEGVSPEVRWVVLLGAKSGEIQVTYENAQNIMDIVISENAELRLAQRYPKSYLAFEQLKKENNLPSLKASLGGHMKMGKLNDAFYGDKGHKEF